MKKKNIMGFLLSMVLVIQMIMPGSDSQAASPAGYSLSGSAHIQTYADTAGKWDGTTLTLGTTGEAKRLEAITINLTNNTGYSGSIEYRVHRQTYGWTGWVANGQPAGTTGEAKRLEAIQIRLTGELAEHYDVRYRVHAQTYGWAQGWQYNGALAGTTGEAKRLEALEVQIVKKSVSTPSVSYRVHRQTYGWENTWIKNGAVSGTTGEAKRLEAITIAVSGSPYNGNIEYRTHVQSYGWMPWVSNGEMSGTEGQGKRLEAIQIRLTGELAEHYDVYYRVHAESYGWLGWAKNGEAAGTSGYGKRLEAIQIVLASKGKAAPDNIGGVTSLDQKPYHDQDQEATPAEKPVQPVAPDPQPAEHTHTWVPVSESRYIERLYIDDKLILTLKAASKDYNFYYDNKEIIYAEGYSGETEFSTTTFTGNGTVMLLYAKAGMTEYEEPVYGYYYKCGGCDYMAPYDDVERHVSEGKCGVSNWVGPFTPLIDTIPHTVEVKTETVEIVTGYKCSCGATKQ